MHAERRPSHMHVVGHCEPQPFRASATDSGPVES